MTLRAILLLVAGCGGSIEPQEAPPPVVHQCAEAASVCANAEAGIAWLCRPRNAEECVGVTGHNSLTGEAAQALCCPEDRWTR